jgi:hypothetical protein
VLSDLRVEAKKHAESQTYIKGSSPAATSHSAVDATVSSSDEGKEVAEEETASSVKKSRLLGRVKGARSSPAIPSSSTSSTSSPVPVPAVLSALEVAAEASMQKYRDMLSAPSTPPPVPVPHIPTLTPPAAPIAPHASLSVLCRTPLQVAAACSLPYIQEITLDFLEVHGLREAVQEIKNAKKIAVVATPRIIKPNEERLYTFYLRLKADALLVRSAGFLNQLLELGGAGAVLANSNITIPDLRGVHSTLHSFHSSSFLASYSSAFFFHSMTIALSQYYSISIHYF